jgi:large subunit ribosomal protein L25
MNTLEIKGQGRTETGKTQIKTVRKNGMVPCVLHTAKGTVHFSVTEKEIAGLIYTPKTYLVHLNVDGKQYKAVPNETQFHPVHEQVLHVDFVEVRDDKPITVNLPVKLLGTSPGMLAGGKLIQKQRKLRVKGLYTQLPDEIKVDVSSLKLGHSLKVRDLKFDKFSVSMAADVPVCTVEIPRALRQEQPKTGAAAAPAAAAPAAAAPAAGAAAKPAAGAAAPAKGAAPAKK